MTSALVLLLATTSSPAACAGGLDDIRARGVLRAAVKNEGSPDRVQHNDPAHFRKRGFELDILHAIAARIFGDGSKVELVLLKRRQRLRAVVHGKVDLGISMFDVAAGHPHRVTFSLPYYEDGLAVAQEGRATVRGLADLNGMKLAALDERSTDPGGALARLATASGARVTVQRFGRFEDAVSAVERGKADAVVAMHANLVALVADGRDAGLAISPPLSLQRFGIAVRSDNGALLDTVNAVIADLKRTGKLAALRAHWKLAGP